jgi:glycosyltransferase involved in cell wall biosynthesis
MHVVHLETGRHLYGGAQQVLYLLNGLAARGVQTTLVCPPGSAIGTAVADLYAEKGTIEIVSLPMAGDLDVGFAGRFARLLVDLRPDLLHVHSRRGADIWGGVAARKAGVPAVLSRRVDNPDFPMLGRQKYRLYDRVIAISAEIRSRLHADGVPERKLRLVHSAVDAASCQPTWSREQFQAEFNVAGNELAVICVAQFIPRKGHATLLDAWRAVQDDCPHARLILFGRGSTEQDLRRQAERLGIAGSVTFAGFRADLKDYLGCADLLVHPALREGLGICLLEAQAAGLAVVACRAGGVPEAVADGVSGLLVPPQNAGAFAAATVRLLGDPQERDRLGAGGREQVHKHFSLEAMVSGNLGVYEELLEKRSG